MFTGLISELGTVQGITRGESSAVFTITAPQSVAGLGLGRLNCRQRCVSYRHIHHR